MSAPLFMRVMALSMTTSQRAGKIIREILQKGGDLGIIEKGKNDLQTEADRASQRCIIASLTNQFPTLKIIGEEGNSDLNVPSDWIVKEGDEEFLKKTCPEEWNNVAIEDMVIWVDPLDGTSEYTEGFLDHVTVLIGVAVQGKAVGGVIHQPFYENKDGEMGRTTWGVKELGTGGHDPTLSPLDQFIVTTTRSHSDPVVEDGVIALQPTTVIRVGGAGYKILQLIEGKAHAYIFASPGSKKWDTCATEAIVEAYGGSLTDILGKHYPYGPDAEHANLHGIVATNGDVLHTQIICMLPGKVCRALVPDLP